MNTHTTTIGIDLAKNSFHVYAINGQQKVTVDKKMTCHQLQGFLLKQPQAKVAMEACGSAHHWARQAAKAGHTPVLLTPKTVTPFRQGHKTDRTDARAIAVVANQPGVKQVAVKTPEQQGMQSTDRIRQHHVDQLTATSNMIRALLAEHGITIPKGNKALRQKMPLVLEDADNGLTVEFRQVLGLQWQDYLDKQARLDEINSHYKAMVRHQEGCQRLMRLEGIGEVNALKLYLALGEKGGSFENGREAAACIGVTPKQYSTGGVVCLGGIGKKSGNKRLRAALIQGALAVIKTLAKKTVLTPKLQWLTALVERRGVRRAAVALVNKTIRTAWAMLRHGTEYSPEPLPLAA